MKLFLTAISIFLFMAATASAAPVNKYAANGQPYAGGRALPDGRVILDGGQIVPAGGLASSALEAAYTGGGQPFSGGLISKAKHYLGKTASQLGLPASLWCADFVNLLKGERHGDRRALAYARKGRPASQGCVGCVAVVRGGHHVGVVEGYTRTGNPILISGNSTGRRVAEGAYSKRGVVAYRSI
jgi:hypothetical protein